MIKINGILLQLDKAVELANSTFVQERSMSVILFDNLIEVQLYGIAERKFSLDRTTWYNGVRIHSLKKRNDTLSYYDCLLKFSKDSKVINESDFEILKYAHSLRNLVYHKGILNQTKIDLAILLYYDFICRFFEKLPDSFGLIGYTNSSDSQEIDFGQGIRNTSFADFKKYF